MSSCKDNSSPHLPSFLLFTCEYCSVNNVDVTLLLQVVHDVIWVGNLSGSLLPLQMCMSKEEFLCWKNLVSLDDKMMIMVWFTLIENHYKPIWWKVFWSSPLNLLFMSAAVGMFGFLFIGVEPKLFLYCCVIFSVKVDMSKWLIHWYLILLMLADVQRTPHLPTQNELPFRIGFDGIEDGTCVMNCCKYNAWECDFSLMHVPTKVYMFFVDDLP